MSLSSLININSKSVVSIIGSGGKTSLLFNLALENRKKSVLVTTTTKIWKPKTNYDFMYLANSIIDVKSGITVIGLENKETGKLEALKENDLNNIVNKFDIVLLECDGSKGLSLKGWNEHEPVIPNFTTHTIGVMDFSLLGEIVTGENIHRFEAFSRLTGVKKNQALQTEHLINMVCGDKGLFGKSIGKKILFINKIETNNDLEIAYGFIDKLLSRYKFNIDYIVIGSCKNKDYILA